MKTPREQFLKNAEAVAQLSQLLSSSWFQHVLTVALAEMASKSPFTEEMRGANNFIIVLESLTKEEELPPLPRDPNLETYQVHGR